jgi:class 3 adenylate cyclase
MMRLLRAHAEHFQALLREYQGLLRGVFEEMGGHEVEVSGDTVMAAFPTAKQATLSAVAAQRALAGRERPTGRDLR